MTVDRASLPAGEFSSWLRQMRAALQGEGGSDVPCNGCTACCTSSKFVHIEPDEADTLARIPKELLAPAPLLPKGHVVLGYDENGHCPMLVDGRCSIYEHRPRTCRTYDCRVFAAAGVELDDDKAVAIGERAGRWEFTMRAAEDQADVDAVRAAARFLSQDGHRDATQVAVLAVELYDLFLDGAQPDRHAVRSRVEALRHA